MLLWVLHCTPYKNQLGSMMNVKIPGWGPKINKSRRSPGICIFNEPPAVTLVESFRGLLREILLYCSPEFFPSSPVQRMLGEHRDLHDLISVCDDDCNPCPGQRELKITRWVEGQGQAQTLFIIIHNAVWNGSAICNSKFNLNSL